MIKWATSGFYGQLVSVRVGFSSLRGPDEKIAPLAPKATPSAVFARKASVDLAESPRNSRRISIELYGCKLLPYSRQKYRPSSCIGILRQMFPRTGRHRLAG
jgi:hypothetical protein